MKYVPDTELTFQMVHSSMVNGYMYLIKGETIIKAYERNASEQIYYPFDTDKPISKTDLRLMLNHFSQESIEDFEKCIELKNLYDRIDKQSRAKTFKNEM